MEVMKKHESMWDGHLDLDWITIAKYLIVLNPLHAPPIHSRTYRAGPKLKEPERKENDIMLQASVAKPAMAEWASQVVFVRKKDGNLRFCVDYRRLNVVTVPDSYPITRMDEYFASIGEGKMFWALDRNLRYWQIEMDDEDDNNTGFVIHHELFDYSHLPLRLVKIPTTFQQPMDVIILASFKWQHSIIYIDEIIISFKDDVTAAGTQRRRVTLITRCRNSDKIKKCFFFSKRSD